MEHKDFKKPAATDCIAQQAAAKADQRHAIDYASNHPHGIAAEAGQVVRHGVFDVTKTGLSIGVGTGVDILKVGGSVVYHVLSFIF